MSTKNSNDKSDIARTTPNNTGKNDNNNNNNDDDNNNHHTTTASATRQCNNTETTTKPQLLSKVVNHVNHVVDDVEVSVIIPVHNAAATIVQAVRSAMHQVVVNCNNNNNPKEDYNIQHQSKIEPDEEATAAAPTAAGLLVISSSASSNNGDDKNDDDNDCCRCHSYYYYRLQVFVCCYDDGSTDDSWTLLQELQDVYETKQQQPQQQNKTSRNQIIPTRLLIGRGNVSQGAGFARNRAVEMRTSGRGNDDDDAASSISSSNTTSSSSKKPRPHNFLCFLDSDDYMHPTRISEQCRFLLSLLLPNTLDSSNSSSDSPSYCSVMDRTLLGCTFDRDPPDATWHYAHWANRLLTDDRRLLLECYREMTLIQPTWMMSRSWFEQVLGGYIEAPALLLASSPPLPLPSSSSSPFCLQEFIAALQAKDNASTTTPARVVPPRLRLVHPSFETLETLRVAEDLRLFHAHLHAGGELRLLRTTTAPSTSTSSTAATPTASSSSSCSEAEQKQPIQQQQKQQRPQALVTYRHANGSGQSSQTPRRLLLHLRVLAFEINVLQKHPLWQPASPSPSLSEDESASVPASSSITTPCFCIWGAGRDGKDFIKALSPEMRRRVACMVDVDANKILPPHGYYTNRDLNLYNLPILHFSLLCRDAVLRQELYTAFLRQSSSTNGDDIDDADDVGSNNDVATGNKAQAAFGRINKGRVTHNAEDDKDKSLEPAAVVQQQQQAATSSSSSPLATTSGSSSSRTKNKNRRLLHNNSNNSKQNHYSQELLEMLPSLPVVVCVAMYRTGGALEKNVGMIGRTEGEDLWHFC